MSRVSLFVKTELVPNGESRTGLSHSDIVTSVDLIPTFDSFVVLVSLCSRRKQWERWYVKETKSVQGMQTEESVFGQSLQASEHQSNSTLLHEELETDRVQLYRRTVARLNY